ncbi:hypothetical protein IG631_00296 [Alternaria alternata]|nr:hypothetical protein IG631_00296 [Alternaria alternata]
MPWKSCVDPWNGLGMMLVEGFFVAQPETRVRDGRIWNVEPCADLVSRACNIAKAALRPTPPVISSCVRFIRGYDFPDDTNTTKYYAMQGNLNWTSTTAKLATCGTPEADNARLPVLSPIRSLSLVVSCMEELIGRQGQ